MSRNDKKLPRKGGKVVEIRPKKKGLKRTKKKPPRKHDKYASEAAIFAISDIDKKKHVFDLIFGTEEVRVDIKWQYFYRIFIDLPKRDRDTLIKIAYSMNEKMEKEK